MTQYVCDFCKRQWAREKSFVNHSCEKKRRWWQKDQAHARFAFIAWKRFYELNSFKHNTEFTSNYKNFIDSKFYNDFIKFGIHIRDLNALEPAKFIEYVLKSNLPISKWRQDFVYEQYVRELTHKETAEDALTRNIMLMNEWSIQTGESWVDFFRKVNTNQATAWIRTGRISPWVLYNTDSSVEFLERCTSEQLSMIKEYANPSSWKIKFNKNADSCNFIRKTLKESGM